MIYKCELCDKIFYTKFNYERHLRRKRPCKDTITNLSDPKEIF